MWIMIAGPYRAGGGAADPMVRADLLTSRWLEPNSCVSSWASLAYPVEA